MSNISLTDLKNAIRNIPDFPKPGIQFKDITTLLSNAELFQSTLEHLYESVKDKNITKVVAIESRGFIFGGALTRMLGAAFVPVRKPGKLPYKTFSENYELEYGTNSIEIHQDSLNTEDNVLIHDDLLATGGTALAALNLVKKFNAKNVTFTFICELDFLKGRKKISDYEINSLIHF